MTFAIIRGQPDTLDEAGRKFERPRLTTPVFLNSVPKSGTHLIRNILRMFVAEEQHWNREYIQHPILRQSLDAFSAAKPWISWGHLLFSDDAAIALRETRHIVLVRDPYDWVGARTRFYLAEEFQGPFNHLKSGQMPVEDMMNMMILGLPGKLPGLLDMYTFNAVAWMGTRAVMVKYEDIVEQVNDLSSARAERYFTRLLGDCGVDLPADWRERVETGADRKQSRTASENLSIAVEVPKELPEAQKRLVDFAAPGLRQVLGYA
ncbi:MAG: hypothetical protein IT546_09035 [Caulobacteraceae bacterium]|nr:hypothetical protein [Caulobacteraceae bacterium]